MKHLLITIFVGPWFNIKQINNYKLMKKNDKTSNKIKIDIYDRYVELQNVYFAIAKNKIKIYKINDTYYIGKTKKNYDKEVFILNAQICRENSTEMREYIARIKQDIEQTRWIERIEKVLEIIQNCYQINKET